MQVDGDSRRASQPKRFQFVESQKRRLRALGVPRECLDNLTAACSLAQDQGWFDRSRPPPTQKQLLDAVSDMQKLSKALKKRLESLPGALNSDLYEAGVNVEILSVSLAALGQVCESLLPSIRNYKKTGKAPTNPIELIRRALPDAIKSSSSPTGPFRRIVGVCYEAMGANHCDAERAIKGWLKDGPPGSSIPHEALQAIAEALRVEPD